MSLDLRLIIITDRAAAGARGVRYVVAECLEAGAPAVQLRRKDGTAAQLLDDAHALRSLTERYGALLFVNDRLDVALAAGADGVHLGPDDLPVAAARAVTPATFHLGYSTDVPADAVAAAAAGAAYIGCGAVFGTTSKAEVGGERIGTEGLRRVVEAVPLPVIGIGGIGPANVGEVAATGAAGVAVIRAVMAAAEPGRVVEALLSAFPRPG